MSEIVPHRKTIGRTTKIREYRSSLTLLDFNEGSRPVKVLFADGSKGYGTCLGCHDAPCMTLGVSDTILPEALSDFPGDPARDVCPTYALSWNAAGSAIVVDDDKCIGCGLCIARCPYGAISLTNAGKVVIETTDPNGLTVRHDDNSASVEHLKTTRKGQIGTIQALTLRQMPSTITSLSDLESSQFVRNLLIECGVECRIRRRGDTNIRMDGVLGLLDNRLGVLEIELTDSVLESPRALLEDVAVLHGRYGIEVGRIDPVTVVLTLPNARSEYYQVIADIERVLGIRCRTMTVGCLLGILWQFQTIVGFSDDLFMTSPGDTDLLPAMKRSFGDRFPMIEPYSGAYRPSK